MNNKQNKGRVNLRKNLLFLILLLTALIILSVLFLRQSKDVANIKKDKEISNELKAEKDKDQTKLKRLKKKYPDMVGWIEIKGTDFSYPVMQSGIKGHVKDDPEYYLNRNVYGEVSVSGTPFLDSRCRLDSDELIIYGHNMNARQHFGFLQNFRDESFYKKHKDFYYTSVGEIEERYEILSVLVTDIHSDCFKYTDVYNDEDYRKFIKHVITESIYPCDVAKKVSADIKNDSVEAFFHKYQLVTLATCRTGEGRDARLLVIGCKERGENIGKD